MAEKAKRTRSSLHFILAFNHMTVLYFSLNLQFDDIGPHGTKVIIYNLWCTDDGIEELDFDTDPKVNYSFSFFSNF